MSGFLLLILAGALLWAGAELFVENASSAGARLGTTALAIGLLVAGAEPEELITAVTAALRDRGGIAAGDAVGANVTMFTIVFGLAALARPLPVTGRIRRYLVGAAGLGVAAALALTGGLGRPGGAVLVLLYLAGIAFVWRSEGSAPPIGELAELEEEREEGEEEGHEGILGLLLALAGVAVMALGGWAAVAGAERIVDTLGVTDSVVGLTFVALATSAELFALAVAAFRRQVAELAVAGVVGSAAYNATITLGGAALARPIATDGVMGAAWMAAALPLVVLVAGRSGRLTRAGGAVLVAAYGAYLAWLYL
jgi:cation:H+ antiporter